MNPYHKEVLQNALEHRKKEIVEYQINIDNFVRAIEKAKQDPELVAFTEQLQQLLKDNLLEQKKSKIMLEVIQDQLGET